MDRNPAAPGPKHRQGGLSRRDFIRISSAGGSAALAGVGVFPGLLSALTGSAAPSRWLGNGTRYPLRFAREVAPNGIRLVAAPGEADVGGGRKAPGWLIDDSLPSPLLRMRRGDPFDVTLVNGIPDPLILHWHGLTPPDAADGHPRLAVSTGREYPYRFTVENRAGTYWYHSHTHRRVARHTQAGIAGMIIVHDEEEDRLDLPSGAREIPLILQDRQVNDEGLPHYHEPDTMEGHVGDQPFGNGIHRPYLDVDTALYRLRLLNGSNARIFRLERSDGGPMVMIGNDGGLLERPVPLTSLDLAPGERADLLLDLSQVPVGQRVMLRSRPFTIPGAVVEVSGRNIHDLTLDLLELRVARQVDEPARIPEVLAHVPGPDPRDSVRERNFEFSFDRDEWSRTMERHYINGKMFEMDRIDARVPFGETEIWSFVNDGWFAHPVHLHGTHFRVLSREGGRGKVMPWEAGLKDTVLIHPRETVRVAVRFDAHRGLFPLHCHNLEHEDLGMMLNVQVE